jgi:hypothetical protein
MNLEMFKELIKAIQDQNKRTNDLYKLGMDITESNSGYYRISEILLSAIFGVGGYDIITWWLYETTDKVITSDDEKYDVLSIDNLYNYLEKFHIKKECKCKS